MGFGHCTFGQTRTLSFGTKNKQLLRKILKTIDGDGWLRCRCQELNEASLERRADDEDGKKGRGNL